MHARTATIPSVWTSDAGTMAKETAEFRWPKIVQGMIEDLDIAKAELDCSTDGACEIESLREDLEKLMKDIMDDESLSTLEDNESADIASYNQQLSSLGKVTWLDCPWLFGECYLYRRVQLIFSTSSHWKYYDIFKRKKDSTLIRSKRAVEELSDRFSRTIMVSKKPVNDLDDDAARLLFTEMSELALWGNATDLSLLTNLSLEEIQKLQGREAIEKNQRNIVDNDMSDVWEYLRQGRCQSTMKRHVDIILDNAGFELFADVLYSVYLLSAGLCSSITLHAKCFPWFVSDALPQDLDSLMEHLSSKEGFADQQNVRSLASQIKQYVKLGVVTIEADIFWTTSYSFQEMASEAPALLRRLKDSYLTIWKGDLNYRKLTRDGLWPHTTSFKTALGPLGEGSGVKILALRTNKSDTCVGIDSEQRVKALDLEAPGKAWVRNGKYAVVSFSDGT